MAQPSPEADAYSVLEGQVRECFGRVVYSHKTHEKDADLCGGTLRNIKLIQIILGAITASGAVAVIFADAILLKVATAGVSLVTLGLTGYMKGFDPGASAQKHRDTAADLWAIREAYLSLLTDIVARRLSLEDVCTKRDELQAALGSIYKSAPHTTPKAYGLAQTALQRDEEYTFNDGEIDKFLPRDLRRDTRK
ncbi:MAG: SLATT domain-containing protein [Phenylobacterium sp.]|uniref:SLATT domain-containing protein n=1 Tax=Phenylobacterium sp. TaxID=1871053 RepID=UPI001B432863|nr:SLATT domain-containing protein [Phenylobacterium sp.]MBP7817698.1 SLATT domain-containing protein [Phenylobacterium sp.]MBP9230555.1 SLATT domain-containing protein [Phenylobacterium sp.]